ncbi:hypothetical protein HN371_27970 [Candidatus Poribacteria bacterium]|nr:hypothetical protein [Candidatus Poribacteria bacterium]MBT5536203.1 hypothetical protein [Candidatus Poribacteria bacterium]MBT5714588.1 hypothetical protein [Candidatus Poribacteria bacterium]MBT7101335.1 hypothetical protein [Candidatus Poribacteria bacterium]MBT7807506.1 hypothetical protein [Candidatus Poribacteria bacterium]
MPATVLPDNFTPDDTLTAELWSALADRDVPAASAALDGRPDAVHERAAQPPTRFSGPPAPYKTNTPLTYAAVRRGQADMLGMLLGRGADVNALGYNENKGIAPAIVLAGWEGDVDMLRVLLEAGADPNLPASNESALYAAIEHTAADAPTPNKVSVLLDGGARHDIFTAAMVGDVEAVREQVDACPGLLSQRSPKRGRTPLEEAAEHGQQAAAEALILLGAEVTLHAAARLGMAHALQRLLAGDPRAVEVQDDSGMTLLVAATMHSRLEAMGVLLAAGADPNAAARWGYRALPRAVGLGDVAATELLLSAGADPDLPGRLGKLPVDRITVSDPAVAGQLRALLSG